MVTEPQSPSTVAADQDAAAASGADALSAVGGTVDSAPAYPDSASTLLDSWQIQLDALAVAADYAFMQVGPDPPALALTYAAGMASSIGATMITFIEYFRGEASLNDLRMSFYTTIGSTVPGPVGLGYSMLQLAYDSGYYVSRYGR